MTISDKIRIYELSRDLNLENKDILDAAQKLSISVKSHSSSISAEEAKKIKNLINKKNSDKKILSINKSSIKKDNFKQNKEDNPSIKKDNFKHNKEDKPPFISSKKGNPLKDKSNIKPLLIKPLNKPESVRKISNQLQNPNKSNIINNSQSRANLTNTNIKSKPSQNLNQNKKTFENNTTPPIKSPAKPPIQLIAKPKNINNNVKSNESSQNISNAGNQRRLSNKPDQNPNKPKTKNFNKDAKGNNPLCGDNVHVYLKLNDQRKVEDISFEGSGCAISMASASIMTDLIKGKSDNEAKEIIEDFLGMIKENPELKNNILKEDDKTKVMCLSGVKQYPMRVKCATLSWHTLISAMENDGKEITTEN